MVEENLGKQELMPRRIRCYRGASSFKVKVADDDMLDCVEYIRADLNAATDADKIDAQVFVENELRKSRDALAEWSQAYHPEITNCIPDQQKRVRIWETIRAALNPVENDTIVIDLDQESWEAIKEAASQSDWMPPEYFMNDWVSDVCAFLKHRDGPVENSSVNGGWQTMDSAPQTALDKIWDRLEKASLSHCPEFVVPRDECHYYELIKAALGGVNGGWQTIETAPRDGTPILACGGGLEGVEVVRYLPKIGAWDTPQDTLDDTDYELLGFNRPTLWQTLPPVPALPPVTEEKE